MNKRKANTNSERLIDKLYHGIEWIKSHFHSPRRTGQDAWKHNDQLVDVILGYAHHNLALVEFLLDVIDRNLKQHKSWPVVIHHGGVNELPKGSRVYQRYEGDGVLDVTVYIDPLGYYHILASHKRAEVL